MGPWLSRLLLLGASLFVAGWGLVLVSGYGGNSVGGSELVWRVGGVMLYASVPVLVAGVVLALFVALRSAGRRRCRRA